MQPSSLSSSKFLNFTLKISFCLGCLFFSSVAIGEWMLIGNNNKLDEFYIDRIEKVDEGHIKYWALTNYKEKSSEGVNSLKRKVLGDCVDLSLAVTYTVTYAKPMGNGDVMGDQARPFPSYQPLAPNTIGESMLALACSKGGLVTPAVKTALVSALENELKITKESSPTQPEPVNTMSSTVSITPLEAEEVAPPAITPVENEQGKFKVSVKSIQANIRELPDTASKVLGTVQTGMILTASNISGSFYEVTTSVGKGFIHKSTVDLVPLGNQAPSQAAKNI